MNLFDSFSVVRGIAISDDKCLLAVMNDELAQDRTQHSVYLQCYDGVLTLGFGECMVPWLTAGMVRTDGDVGEVLIVGWAGQVLVVGQKESHREAIIRSDSLPVSIIRAVTTVGDVTYAAGMGRQVYVRRGGTWSEVDHAIVNEGDAFGIGLNAVDGFSRDEIYAAGTNGEIWSYSGNVWRRIQSPTNAHLHSLICGNDGTVYVGGRSGTLLKGRGDVWEIIDLELESPVADIKQFDGRMYLIVRGEVVRLSGTKVDGVDAGAAQGDFVNMSLSAGKLWAFGPKQIVSFDGARWEEVTTTLAENGTENFLRRGVLEYDLPDGDD